MPARRMIALVVAAIAAPLPALAHHPMGGAAAGTVWEGIASGVAHPVIGLDHLVFLLAAGILAAVAPRRIGLPALLGFLGAGLAGALLHLAGIGLGAVEGFVALTLVAAGAALLAGPGVLATAAPMTLALGFGAAGLVHGHALAEAVAGSPAATVAAYLLTLALTQGLIGLAAMAAARRWAWLAGAALRRIAGLGTASFGAIALVLAALA